MSARDSGGGRPDKGTHAKSGKPRPGTGGYGRRRLEGKGPTPPAYLRPGHPAQRKTAGAARAAGARRSDDDDTDRGTRGPCRPPGRSARRGWSAGQRRRAGDGRRAQFGG